jgi:hypothetical protein
MDEYKKVTSYDELLKLNVDFINGVINWTPYHQQSLKVGPLKDELINVNEMGFLTLGGQCAEDTPTQEKKLFLDGYIHPDFVRNLTKYLKNKKKLEYFIELPNKEIKTNIRNWHNAVGKNIYYNSLSRVKDENQEWKDTFVIPFADISNISENNWKGFDNIINILKNYAFVHIQHRSFHNLNNDIYTTLIGYFKTNSFKPKKQSQFGSGYTIRLKQLYSDLKKLIGKKK